MAFTHGEKLTQASMNGIKRRLSVKLPHITQKSALSRLQYSQQDILLLIYAFLPT